MAFKITLKDWISIFFEKNNSESTLSLDVNKKFSDVKAYIEGGKFGKSLVGRVTRQTDDGFIYCYEYNLGQGNEYCVTVEHSKEKATRVELYRNCPAAFALCKDSLNAFEKKVPNLS